MDARVPLRDGASLALAWLSHPATVLALVVLLVNDHLLKAAFPGPVTGKLSDVAGLVLAPPLVAVLLTLVVPRLPVRAAVVVGLVSVGAGFAVVKSNGYAAELASAAWTALAGPSLVRADPTDLFTLPALGLAWWSWTRSRQHPVRLRAVRVVRLVVLLPSAMLAVAATSAVHYPYALGASTVAGRPAIAAGSGSSGSWPEAPADGQWSISDDAGRTWRPASAGEEERLDDEGEPRRRACTPSGDRCYRVVAGHLRVEESEDGGRSWRTAWEIPDDDREPLARRYSQPGDVGRHFSSRELAVYTSAGGGHGVVVANGREGFAVRHPDGRWERAGWFDLGGLDPLGDRHPEEPPPLGTSDPGQRGTDVLLALALALTLGFAVVGVAAHLVVRRARGSWLWSAGALSAGLLVAAALAGVWDTSDEIGVASVLAVFVLPLGALTAIGLLVVATTRGAGDGWRGEVFIAFVVTVMLAGLPLAGWLFAVPPRTRTAVLLAVVATLPGLWLARRAARLAGPAAGPGTRWCRAEPGTG